MDDLSGWGTARKMVELYGQEAQTVARTRSQKALDEGDSDAFLRWSHIAAMLGGHPFRAAPSAGAVLPQTEPSQPAA